MSCVVASECTCNYQILFFPQQPVAVGRGRGRGSAISRAAAAPVTPGGLSVSSKTENEEPSDPVSTAKAIRRTRKKLAQVGFIS